MEHTISRSEKKRQAKSLEVLTQELVTLATGEIAQLPCDTFLQEALKEAKRLKGGARKRQVKYITKHFRSMDCTPLYSFLSEKKGSKLKETKLFHELEHMRDQILAEAFDAHLQAEEYDEQLDSRWQSETVTEICASIPTADVKELTDAAIKFTRTRKPVFKREIFRILKAAHEEMVAQKEILKNQKRSI